MDFGDAFRTLGSLAGLAALCWRGIDEFTSFLRISVDVSGPENDWITILSTVDNKGFRPKALEWAFLLVGPEDESPIDTANSILEEAGISQRITYTNELFDLKEEYANENLGSGFRRLIPLAFFYSENVRVSDETLTYKSPLNIADFPDNAAFSVRLYVNGAHRLHRSTQSCFIVAHPAPVEGENA